MVQHRRFMDLALTDEGLQTPDGVLDLAQMTKADLIRNRAHDSRPGEPDGYGAAGVVGGALLGGAIAGPIGALGGGILGSTVKRDRGTDEFPRTVSATLIFESPALAYSTTVSVDRVEEAAGFAAAVKVAAGL